MKILEFDNNKLINFYSENENIVEAISYSKYKNNNFFLKNGFIYDKIDIISDGSKKRSKFNKICHPNVMIYK